MFTVLVFILSIGALFILCTKLLVISKRFWKPPPGNHDGMYLTECR